MGSNRIVMLQVGDPHKVQKIVRAFAPSLGCCTILLVSEGTKVFLETSSETGTGMASAWKDLSRWM